MFKQQPSALARAAITAAIAAAGCAGRTLGDDPPPIDPRLPIADAYLDRSYGAHAGLLTALQADGTPLTEGPQADPLINEARRFYDTVQYPYAQPVPVDYPDPFTGQQDPYRKTAPLTLSAWKRAFGFPDRQAGEDVGSYRARAGVVIYYNRNELGLGRELGCAQFVDGLASDGSAIMGTACFVTNYGVVFNDPQRSLEDTAQGQHPRNTVCITHRPTLGPGYEVQFYTFAGNGRRIEWAQLDTLGPRPHPHVCMNCHGGSYDADRHLAKSARFLPLDPSWLAFVSDDGPYSRQAQEERIRQLNEMSMSTNLTAAQVDYFTGMYDGAPREPGRVAQAYVPPGWRASATDADIYRQVVRPYCGTCHLAIETDANGVESSLLRGLSSRSEFAKVAIIPYVCSFQMPNAQPTMTALWRMQPVLVGGASYASGADALLGAFVGGGRELCTNLATAADCRRGPDPDALCGDAHSGTACDQETGQCMSSGRTLAASSDPANSMGICRMDGSRACPHSEQCRSENTGLAGYDGACYMCGRAGMLACDGTCEPGLTPDGTGTCVPAS